MKDNITDGCIASPHWDACETCVYNDPDYGCEMKGAIPLTLYDNSWILCDDYERRN